MISVVLMAGDGIRFKEKGYDIPKPFIKIKNDISILDYTLRSVPDIHESDLYFTLRTDWDYKGEDELKLKYPNCHFVYFDKLTRGNLETAFMSVLKIENCDLNEDILFLDSDNHYDGTNFIKYAKSFHGQHGVVCCFEPIDDSHKWGFVLHDNTRATGFLEKDPQALSMGGLPMIGSFYFSSVRMFKKVAEKILNSDNKVKNEFYMTQVMQELLDESVPVFTYKASKMVPLGTPEDFELAKKSFV